MRILLTGASSSIGIKLTEKIISNLGNFNEIFLITHSNLISKKINFDHLKKVKLINQNLLNQFSAELKNKLSKIDCLIHFAWIRPTNPNDSIKLNLEVIEKIMENLKSNTKVIFLSSVAGIPDAISYYGKSKYLVSKKIYNTFNSSIFISGLIMSDSENSWFHSLKSFYEKLPILIKFGNNIKVLHTNSNNVVNAIYSNIFNFQKGVFKLYNNDDISLDNFIKKNSTIERKLHININWLLNFFLLAAKYINYIPFINKISEKMIILITNSKLKTDEFIKRGL